MRIKVLYAGLLTSTVVVMYNWLTSISLNIMPRNAAHINGTMWLSENQAYHEGLTGSNISEYNNNIMDENTVSRIVDVYSESPKHYMNADDEHTYGSISSSMNLTKRHWKEITVPTYTERCTNNEFHNVSYVIPHFAFGPGPNTAYKKIRWTVAFALYYHMGTVAIPTLDHRTQSLEYVNTSRTFEETFDLDRLRELIPVISPASVECMCKGSLRKKLISMKVRNTFTDVLKKYPLIKNLDYRLPVYNQLLNISMSRKIISIQHMDVNMIPKSRPCIGLIPYEMDVEKMSAVNELVDRYLIRARYIRNMAENSINNICNGHFAVMHWRNKTGERCYIFDCPKNQRDTLESLVNHAVPEIVDGVTNIMISHNITCLYIAKPKYEQSIVSRFHETSLDIYTIESIFKLNAEINSYKKDNYVLSLVEQEISERVPLFISSRSSNWSFYVEYTRSLRLMKTIGLDEIPYLSQELLNHRLQLIK